MNLPKKYKDITNQRFGRLVAIRPLEIDKWKQVIWECKCDCGVVRNARGKHLWSGKINSCGCYRMEWASQKAFRHGYARKNQVQTTWTIWESMKQRCNNLRDEAYSRYGGRGITVCKRWAKFENFLKDMGERPDGKSLDRYPNNDGNYEPSNCRWATPKQQNRNRRDNRIVEFNGQRKCLAEWVAVLGLNYNLMSARLIRGWSAKLAFETPRLATNHWP